MFVLYDVCERIQLDQLRGILNLEPASRQPTFKHPAPDYVRFERPPVIQQLDPVMLESGEQLRRRVKYFDYGIVSVEFEMSFEADWRQLVRISSRWINAPEFETRSTVLVRAQVEAVRPAIVQLYESWLSEDYYVTQIHEASGADGEPLSAKAMLATHGGEIAQIVRGESSPLSDGECSEVLQSSLSYYPRDLIVVGWVAALLYDSPENAVPAIQILEYANTQLLEYRHYDNLLTRLLADVYKYLERRGILRPWRMAREAGRLNTILLDIRDLSERTDNAIKFLSDMFYARAYKIASERVGVTDYRRLVDEKLRTAGELYGFMVNEFHQSRGFVLELMVVAILVIELVHLFWR